MAKEKEMGIGMQKAQVGRYSMSVAAAQKCQGARREQGKMRGRSEVMTGAVWRDGQCSGAGALTAANHCKRPGRYFKVESMELAGTMC